MKSIFILLLSLYGIISCVDTEPRKYIIKESYEVTAGAQSGMKGNSSYTITIFPVADSPGELLIENFANNYKVKALAKGDTVIIPNQNFEFYDSRVHLSGSGILQGDSIIYNYFSGGPAGRINCICVGKKLKN